MNERAAYIRGQEAYDSMGAKGFTAMLTVRTKELRDYFMMGFSSRKYADDNGLEPSVIGTVDASREPINWSLGINDFRTGAQR